MNTHSNKEVANYLAIKYVRMRYLLLEFRYYFEYWHQLELETSVYLGITSEDLIYSFALKNHFPFPVTLEWCMRHDEG